MGNSLKHGKSKIKKLRLCCVDQFTFPNWKVVSINTYSDSVPLKQQLDSDIIQGYEI